MKKEMDFSYLLYTQGQGADSLVGKVSPSPRGFPSLYDLNIRADITEEEACTFPRCPKALPAHHPLHVTGAWLTLNILRGGLGLSRCSPLVWMPPLPSQLNFLPITWPTIRSFSSLVLGCLAPPGVVGRNLRVLSQVPLATSVVLCKFWHLTTLSRLLLSSARCTGETMMSLFG